MMSRVDYRIIADGFARSLENEATDIGRMAVARAVRLLADEFKNENRSRFRYDTFFLACGLDAWGDLPEDDDPPINLSKYLVNK